MMQYQKQAFISGLFAILALASFQVSAARLFATTIPASGSTSTLVYLNPADGTLSAIGPVGYNITGLAYDDSTGTLYGVTWKNDLSFPNGLISINQITGAGTPIGTGAGLGTPVLLAINSSGELYGWLEPSDRLIKWDKQTGSAIQLHTNNSGIATSKHGIAFDNTDSLFLFNGRVPDQNGVHLINTSTGFGTSVGTLNPTAPNGMAHHGDFHPDTNKYYGLHSTKAGSKKLVVINGLVTESIIPTANDLHALAFAPDPILLGECDGTGGFSVKDVVCTIDKAIDADPNATLGECDTVAGLNRQDVTCSIDKALGPQF